MVSRRRRWAIASLALLAALPRLSRGQTSDGELRWTQADSVAAVGERTLVLRAHAWRDFMPRPDTVRAGSDLMVNLQIHSVEGQSRPPGLTVDSAWVRCGDGEWSTAPTREPRPELADGLDLMLRGGPQWSTGQAIDVLVRLRLPAGEVRYLQARRRPIGRTE